MGIPRIWLFGVTLLLMLLVVVPVAFGAEEPCGFDRKHAWMLENDPGYGKRIAAQEELVRTLRSARRPLAGEAGEQLTIPVVVHVMHLGEAVGEGSNISDAQIRSAIEAMNLDFADLVNSAGYDGGTLGHIPAADVGIQFCLALRDADNHPSTGIIRHDARGIARYATDGIIDQKSVDGNELAVKDASRWPVDHAYNIWIVSEINGNNGGAGTQGYAYFPGADPDFDGAVILSNVFGTEGTIKTGFFNRTVTHEMGHALDLYHTFEGESCTEVHGGFDVPNHDHTTDLVDCVYDGDLICDTPPHTRNDLSCTFRECPDDNPEPVENFMNYADDVCRDMFTPDQRLRMRAVFAVGGLRQALAASNACEPVSVPVTDFQAPSPTCTGDVAFEDLSSNGPTSWDWSFESGTPLTSDLENPVITYNAPGVFDVSLTATNSVGDGNTETRPDYLRVYQPPPLDASCQVNTLDPDHSAGIGIYKVTFNTINSSSGGAATSEDNGYRDFSCTRTTDLVPGSTHQIEVTTGGFHSGSGNAEDVRAYIDFNNDGLFAETDERIFTSDDIMTDHSGSVTLPQSVVTEALLRMRVVSDFFDLFSGPPEACADQQYGQAEDYGVVFTAQQAPVTDFGADIRTLCAGNAVQFRDRSINGTSSWSWSFAGDASAVSSADSNEHDPLITYNTAGRFGVSLTAGNEIGSGNPMIRNNYISVYDPAAPVCRPVTLHLGSFDTGVHAVTLHTLNSVSGDSLADAATYGNKGYVDFSCTRNVTLDPGRQYPVTVEVGTVNAEFVSIWVDYNNNGVFTDSGEAVYSSDTAEKGVLNGFIDTPGDPVFNTLLRMRVVTDINTLAGPCSDPFLGQVEDYGIIFRLPGDVNDDNNLDLRDVIVALQTLAGLTPADPAYVGADVDNDGRIGPADLVYVLQNIAALR